MSNEQFARAMKRLMDTEHRTIKEASELPHDQLVARIQESLQNGLQSLSVTLPDPNESMREINDRMIAEQGLRESTERIAMQQIDREDNERMLEWMMDNGVFDQPRKP